MPFRSGAIGYSRFSVTGDVVAAPDESLFTAMGEHLVRPPSIGEPKELASGFCTGRHVFDTAFQYDACGFGASLLAAMRVDVAKVPSEIKRAYRAMAEDARRGRDTDGVAALSRASRKEAKEEAEERCRKDLADGKYRKLSMVPFLWDLPSGLLLTPAASDAHFQELKSLFDVAFGLRLDRRSAGTVALDLLSQRGRTAVLEDALPDALVDRPEGPAQDGEDGEAPAAAHFRAAGRPEVPWVQAGGEPNDFLGNVFLLWLWWHCDEREGLIETSGATVAIMIDRLLDMECAWGVTGKQSLRGETPTKVIEAGKALQSGKWPRKLGLTVAAHGQEFRCALQGDQFAVSGLSLAKPEEENRLTPRQVLEQRIDAVLTFDRILVLLYEAFLNDRFGRSWETRAGQLRAWIAAMGGRRTSSQSGTATDGRRGKAFAEVKPVAEPHGEFATQARDAG
ncbi:MAG: hypothetical protein JNL80_00610 [Phycisphaerae bacterium]|jgi:hypothetical protein|nr:hypothetical protein [Phycisphaerae bacterium]